MRHFHGFGSDSAHHSRPPRFFWFGRGRQHGHGGADFFARGGQGLGGGDGFMRGRQFGSDDLQLLIMALLFDGPRHGYELIKLLDTRSKGFYVPSPGMIYPALTYLEEIGHATVELEGNRKRYALTDLGMAHLEENREQADLLLAKLSYFGKKMDVLRQAMADEQHPAGDGSDQTALRELLVAKRKLKATLMAIGEASSDQQTRIAKILDHATEQVAAILRGKRS